MRILLFICAFAMLAACGSDKDSAIKTESELASAGLVPESTASFQKPDSDVLPKELLPPAE